LKKLDKEKILALAPNSSAVANAKKICSSGLDEENPVMRCTCPSRQFPCKHGLALLFEIADGKTFEECEIPEDILSKREKKEKTKAKKEKESAEGTVKEKKAPSKVSKAARTKKINKQIEGLDLIKNISTQLLKLGLSTIGTVSLKEYKDVVKQLGDYYLPGPQILFQKLILEIQEYKEDQDTVHYQQALECLKRLRAIEKKGGEISYTANYRPLSALKYIKQDDSNFSLVTVPTLTYYPGGLNKRIRWASANFEEKDKTSFKKIKTYAKNIEEATKIAKNELKNILTDNHVALLLEFEKIMFVEEEGSKKYILVDKNQKMIELRNNGSKELTTVFYELLPNECLENQVMFVKLFQKDRTIYAEAHSIITDDKIVRLG